MTAPGLNLDFLEGSSFSRRVRPVPGLANVVRSSLCDSPPLQGLQAWQCEFKGRTFGVVIDRRGQKVRLLYIFDLPAEESLFSQKLAEIRGRSRDQEAL